jgi:hypothetical protein
MRSEEELLIAWDAATAENPIDLDRNETDLLARALSKRNSRGAYGKSFNIVPDIQPYIGMVDGKPIGGRAQHREYLKRHDCVEIGNETKHLTQPKEIKGDFNVRKELTEATRQVLGRS